MSHVRRSVLFGALARLEAKLERVQRTARDAINRAAELLSARDLAVQTASDFKDEARTYKAALEAAETALKKKSRAKKRARLDFLKLTELIFDELETGAEDHDFEEVKGEFDPWECVQNAGHELRTLKTKTRTPGIVDSVLSKKRADATHFMNELCAALYGIQVGASFSDPSPEKIIADIRDLRARAVEKTTGFPTNVEFHYDGKRLETGEIRYEQRELGIDVCVVQLHLVPYIPYTEKT